MKPSESSISKAAKFAFIVVISLGVALRITEYLANRSLWIDEVRLAFNIINKSFLGLIFQPLTHEQAAPIGFLLLIKFLVTALGNNEYVLRSFSFFSGIVSLALFLKLLLKCTSRPAAILALFLFSISLELIRYSTEFKPYSSDVLFALIPPLLGMFFLNRPLKVKDSVWLGISGAVIMWFSFPSLFMLAGFGAALSFVYLANKQWGQFRNLCMSFFIWGVNFTLIYFLSVKKTMGHSGLQRDWAQSFLPLPTDPMFLSVLFKKIYYTLDFSIISVLSGAIAFLLGSCVIFKKSKALLLLLLAPIVFAALASVLRQYPFEQRFLLFYSPFVYLLISVGLFFLIDKPSSILKIFGVLLLINTLWGPVRLIYKQIVYGEIYREEIKSVLNYVGKNVQKEDGIYVYYGAQEVFDYYAKSYGLDKYPRIQGITSREHWDNYCQDLFQLRNKKKVWLIFAHVYTIEGKSEEEYMVKYLDSIGIRLLLVEDVGVSAYLYQFVKN